MSGRDIVVMGASAGGISVLTEIAAKLPRELRAAIFITVHTSPNSPGVLPGLLGRAGPLKAEFARHEQRIVPGRIYVAPPDYHLLFKDGRMLLTHGPKENGFRPAVDPMFRTAAREYGPRVVGVVLSGGLDDGTEGLQIVKECSGVTVAQHPEEAMFSSMPGSAIRNVGVDHIARVAEIPEILVRYASEPIPNELSMCPGKGEADIAEVGDNALENKAPQGPPSALTCPECGGALWGNQKRRQLRYQCHVGHVYTGDGLVADVDRGLEQSLWAAVRTMEESAELRRRMARIAAGAPWRDFAPPYAAQAEDLKRRAAVIRSVLEKGLFRPAKGDGRSAAAGGNGSGDVRQRRAKGGKAVEKQVAKKREKRSPRPRAN